MIVAIIAGAALGFGVGNWLTMILYCNDLSALRHQVAELEQAKYQRMKSEAK